MRRWMKKLVSGAVLAGMVITSPGYIPAAGKTVEAAENDSAYEWDNHDRNIIYPASETTAESDSAQSGYGAVAQLVFGQSGRRMKTVNGFFAVLVGQADKSVPRHGADIGFAFHDGIL